MNFLILTLFPEAFDNLIGLVQSARSDNFVNIKVINLRDFGLGKHKSVDDQVFGGFDGMLLKPDVLSNAVTMAKSSKGFENSKVVALTPKGKVWSQAQAQQWSQDVNPKILICGRYAGFDQRFLDTQCDEEVSIGDFVLNGGEVAAMAILESVVRLLPGVVGNHQSVIEDSFSQPGSLKLEAPQYTRPREWQGHHVPEILLSGNHKFIEQWKIATSISETFLKRPELLNSKDMETLRSLLKHKILFENLKSVYDIKKFEKILQWVE